MKLATCIKCGKIDALNKSPLKNYRCLKCRQKKIQFVEINDDEEIFVPSVLLICPKCKKEYTLEAMNKLYLAYRVMTRNNRATIFDATCSTCGKQTQVRNPPVEKYKCKKCINIEKNNRLIGYEKNPLANKRV